MEIKFLTAESVCEGHPDKLCDLIADSVLDACLREDRASRVACEVMATKGRIIVAGEITCSGKVDIKRIVRYTLQKVGYDPLKFRILVLVHKQSSDIANGVDNALEIRNGDKSWYSTLGAGDQNGMKAISSRYSPMRSTSVTHCFRKLIQWIFLKRSVKPIKARFLNTM